MTKPDEYYHVILESMDEGERDGSDLTRTHKRKDNKPINAGPAKRSPAVFLRVISFNI